MNELYIVGVLAVLISIKKISICFIGDNLQLNFCTITEISWFEMPRGHLLPQKSMRKI